VFNDYTNPNTNPTTLTKLTLTLTNPHDIYKEILYVIRSFKPQTTHKVVNLCLMTKLTLILTLKDTTFYDA